MNLQTNLRRSVIFLILLILPRKLLIILCGGWKTASNGVYKNVSIGQLERPRKRLHIGKPGDRRVPRETEQILFEKLFLE